LNTAVPEPLIKKAPCSENSAFLMALRLVRRVAGSIVEYQP